MITLKVGLKFYDVADNDNSIIYDMDKKVIYFTVIETGSDQKYIITRFMNYVHSKNYILYYNNIRLVKALYGRQRD